MNEPLDLDALEATARAVLPELPNPWLEDEGGVVLHPDQPGNSWDGYIVCEVPADGYRRRPVKAHIAAFDPPTVLALIAKLREAETVIAAALNHDPLHGRTEGLHCGGMAPCVRDVLATYKPTNQEGSAS